MILFFRGLLNVGKVGAGTLLRFFLGPEFHAFITDRL